ncbi:MAG: hypothetical protein HYV09_23510 [Deltaproteobacteria bacterium]|nr:hypothetical protein [Deltaproteobacteria bacterium]
MTRSLARASSMTSAPASSLTLAPASSSTTTLRLLAAAAAIAGLAACGPEPEAQTAAKPPPPPPTATAPTPPPPPPEPTPEQHKEAAKAAIDAKDWAKAKSELDAVLAKDPNDVAALKMQAEIATGQNDSVGATDGYYKAAKADAGKDEVLALAAAQGLWAHRRYDDLIGLMQTVTKAHDKSMAAWMYLGMGQYAKQDYAAAAETYTTLTNAFGDEPQLWAELALAQASAGKSDEAKKSAKTALDKWNEARNPKSTKEVKLGKGADEIAMIARAYRRAGDAKAAEGALAKYVVPKDEAAPMLDVERGFARLASKDGKGAAAQADKASKVAGEGFAPAHLLKAAVAAQGKKADEAKTHLAAYDKTTTEPSKLAWERKWVDDLLAGGGEAPKAGAPKAGAPKGGTTKPAAGAPAGGAKPAPGGKK